MAINIVKWHPFKGGNAYSCSDDVIAQRSFFSDWCVHGVLDLTGSCEISIRWGALLKHCSSLCSQWLTCPVSHSKLCSDRGWAATRPREAVPPVLPVESGCWAAELLGKPFGRSLCGPRAPKLLRVGVMVHGVLLPQVLTPSLILPLAHLLVWLSGKLHT